MITCRNCQPTAMARATPGVSTARVKVKSSPDFAVTRTNSAFARVGETFGGQQTQV